jgi:hypothetical protein
MLSFATSVCLLLVGNGNSVAANVVVNHRALLAIEGTLREDVSADIISCRFDDGLYRLEVTLNNWDPARGLFKYSDNSILLPSTRVTFYMDRDELFNGTITALAPKFPFAAPPIVTVVATGQPPAVQHLPLTVIRGQNLFEFSPSLNLSKATIRSTGVTEGMPNLRLGTVLTIANVGQRFSGEYAVSKTIHSFDLSNGYTTRFNASRRTNP